MSLIHPTALVNASAELDTSVSVGPYSIIGPHVRIGSGTQIGPHCVIDGHTTIGRDNHIHGHSVIGGIPQDKKYRGEPTRLEIGDRNVVREFCTFNLGTAQDGGVTRLGHDNWIMAYVHLAHDCQVGNHTIFANNAQLAGHVTVGDWVILGGFTVVHQFVHIGAHAMTAMGTILLQDVPAFVMASGNPAEPHGLNAEGLKRRGFAPATLQALRRAYRALYRQGLSLEEALVQIDAAMHAATEPAETAALRLFADSIRASTRGLLR